jgi:hypothetical protein
MDVADTAKSTIKGKKIDGFVQRFDVCLSFS